jgi:hypothetical protein
MTSKSILPNNGMALCIIIIVVVGLFIHYELGYNFELFNVGGQRAQGRGGRGQRGKGSRWGRGHKPHKPWYHPHTWFTHNVYTTHTHPQNITFDKDKTDALFQRLDLDKSGSIEGTEFNSSLKGEVGNMMNDKNKYVFTA